MRLACVKHAASVRSEPGSNSQVHHTRVATCNPNVDPQPHNQTQQKTLKHVHQRITQSRDTSNKRPIRIRHPPKSRYESQRSQNLKQNTHPNLSKTPNTSQCLRTNQKDAAKLSLPQQIYLSMNKHPNSTTPRVTGRTAILLGGATSARAEEATRRGHGRQQVISATR